jgi:hypothetical protein
MTIQKNSPDPLTPSLLHRFVVDILVVPSAFLAFLFFSTALFGSLCSSLDNQFICSGVQKGSLQTWLETGTAVVLAILFLAWHFSFFTERPRESRFRQAIAILVLAGLPILMRLLAILLFT